MGPDSPSISGSKHVEVGTLGVVPEVTVQWVIWHCVHGAVASVGPESPSLFGSKQVGLGALGVVTEVTIQCVKRHQLLETTSVMTRAEVKANHRSLLQNNKHIR